jgi:hypothetical protein
MPHPGDSNPYRCFLVWRVALTSAADHQAKPFLLFLFTDSYAASRRQQSLPLFPGVACGTHICSGSSSKAFLALFIYGLLCRIQETAIFPLFPGVACGTHICSGSSSKAFLALFIYGLLGT